MSGTPLLRLKVSPDGADAFVVEVMSRDVLIWEKTGHGRSWAGLMKQQDMAPMYALAHLAARRLGLFAGDLATFESTCDFEPLDDDDDGSEAATPTRPARSRARSSRSR